MSDSDSKKPKTVPAKHPGLEAFRQFRQQQQKQFNQFKPQNVRGGFQPKFGKRGDR